MFFDRKILSAANTLHIQLLDLQPARSLFLKKFDVAIKDNYFKIYYFPTTLIMRRTKTLENHHQKIYTVKYAGFILCLHILI